MGSEESMPTSRKIFLVSATALAGHVAALAFHSTIASNIIEFVLVVLAAAACFEAARRTAGYARRFWRLMGAAFVIYGTGQALATYYDSVLHASLEEWWPGDIPFLFHVAPMALALFMSDDGAESREYRWQQWLDFLQVGIVSFSAYLFFLYLPLPLPHSNAALDQLFVQVTFWRGSLLVVGFALRVMLTDSRLVKSLFGRMTLFLAIFTICEGTFNYHQIWRHLPNGTWYELLWTIPRILMIWLATSWREQEDPKLAPKKGP